MKDDKPAFEVRDGKGKSYRIWADGRTEGFDDVVPRLVVNRIPVEMARAAHANPSRTFALVDTRGDTNAY